MAENPLPQRLDSMLVVVGAAGTESYGKGFAEQASTWQAACKSAGIVMKTLGLEAEKKPEAEDWAKLKAELEQQTKAQSPAPLWLVLIGHGTFDGREAKLNLRGRDVSAEELGQWLKPVQREVILVATSSASGPFIKACFGPRRVIVSATKSGDEVFLSRFGEPFAKAIAGDKEADLDQDQQVSVLEAFLFASGRVARFYETEERIATEHALLDDNGDGQGTRAAAFVGVRAKQPTTLDGTRAHELHLVLSEAEAKIAPETRAKRDALERTLRELVAKRATMKDDDYYRELEAVCLQIARLMK